MGSSSNTRIVVSIAVVAALAFAFWVLLLGPKRQDANELGSKLSSLQAEISKSEQEASAASTARREFPRDYHQLVVLGKAVPSGDDTASLLVYLSSIARRSSVQFEDIQLQDDGSGAAPPPPAPTAPTPPAGGTGGSAAAVPASSTVPATEASAALMPLGATVGTAGLGVMPYTLTFKGSFFHIADFIKGIDSLVSTKKADVAVDGPLVTIDGFSLSPDPNSPGALQASFAVTTYLNPPSQGATAGATPSAPPSTSPNAVDTSAAAPTTP